MVAGRPSHTGFAAYNNGAKMIKDLTIDQKILADFMSEISERCYSAGWMTNLEYVLWDTLTSGPRKYGHDTISQSDIVELRKYSEKADSWIFFDDDIDEIGLSISEWTSKFKIAVENNTTILNR